MRRTRGKKSTVSIYIDALALVPEKKSGVGYTLEQTFSYLANLPKVQEHYIIYLVVPLGKAKYLQKYLRPGVYTKTIYLPAKILEVFFRLNIFPPVDWVLGSGVYIFPNYRNWPLWHSGSLTYIYDLGFIRYPETVQPKNQRYLARYIKRWVSRTDMVLTITNQMRNEIEKYLDVIYTKVSVIYCGIDRTVFYRRGRDEITQVKTKYNIPYNNYFLFVGNIEPRKNLVRLLEAYEELPKHIKEKHGLVLVGGDGWLNEPFYEKFMELQQAGYKLLKVTKFVTTDDLPALYSGATALIHPAIYEGFGIPPLEAMACETPVAVSDIPTIREVVQSSGYYFDPNSPKSIAQAITEIVTAKGDEQLIKEAKSISEVFSWQESAKELIREIEQIIIKAPQKHPIIRRLKAAYVLLDRKLRALMGDRTLQPYRPAEAMNKKELRSNLLNDFLAEQPSWLQRSSLSIYQGLKHAVATLVRSIYHAVRS